MAQNLQAIYSEDRAWNKDSKTRGNFTENHQKIAPGSFCELWII